MNVNQTVDPTYLMGRTDAETRRLIFVSQILNPFTQRMLTDAGVAEGMRVLDIGAGAGDVALVAAALVGPGGSVVAMDQNPHILKTAFARAQASGLDNVSCVAGDCRDTVPDRPFDAVVGRLVLMYLPDPADVLGRLAGHLSPGGFVAFQDYNSTVESFRTSPPTALWGRSCGWLIHAMRSAGIPAEMGFDLRRVFLRAGLPEPDMRLESTVGGGPDAVAYEWMAESVRSMLPLIVKFGVATEAEIGVDTLASRLRAETLTADGVVKGPDLVSAWTRTS